MENRVNIEQLQPDVWKAMYALSISLTKPTLTPIQKELIKVRASQINSCAFCINMHTREALQAGETQQRIFLLNAWRETNLFTEEEKVILAMTEEVTMIHQHGLSDGTYQLAQKFFSNETIAEIIVAIVLINTWKQDSCQHTVADKAIRSKCTFHYGGQARRFAPCFINKCISYICTTTAGI